MRRLTLTLIAGAGVAAVLAAGLGLAGHRLHAPPAPTQSQSARIGGPFTLVDQKGRPVTDADFKGRPTVMFFGFTYCPEVCPITLAAMTAWLKALGPDADKLNLAYVTIDPERDTPKRMALYLSSFDPRIRGLGGTPAQTAAIARAYGVYYQKVPLEGGGYTMDHSTQVYLMDRDGRLSGLIGYGEPPDQAQAKLRKLIDG